MTATQDLVGVGLYSLADCARLLVVPRAKVSRWVRGYFYNTHGGRRQAPAVIATPPLAGVDDEPVLTFLHLMELRLVKEFRSHGISLPVIRAAAERLSRVTDSRHPLALERLATDGKRVFGELAVRPELASVRPAHLTEELHNGQIVVEEFVRPFYIHSVDCADGIIARFWPLGKDKRLVLDPTRSFGAPIDAETGVPTLSLNRAMQAEGASAPRVAQRFRVPVEAVEQALEYELSLEAE